MTMKSEKEASQGVTMQLVWGSSDNLPTVYANNLYVTHAGNEFYLVFGEVSSVAIAGLDMNNLPEYLEIKPVAKIVVMPENMERFVNTVSENFARFKEKGESLRTQENGNPDD